MVRYAQASKTQVSYAIETTAYTKESPSETYFGLVRDEFTPPTPNPHTPMSTSGARRGPHTLSPDPREYQFTIPFNVLDHNAPFEVALGQRTSTVKNSGTGDEYTEHLIEEADRLPTMTVEQAQDDLALQQWFTGAKANLSLSGSQGEPVNAEMELMAAGHSDDDATASFPALSIPQITPYRFWMVGDVQLDATSDGSPVKSVATVSSFDLSWDNALEADHHKGRDPYAITETGSADKYDMSLGITIEDLDLYKRARDDEALVDIELPFVREETGTPVAIDAMYVRLKGCKITSAPIPNPSEGQLVPDVEVQPRDTEIEFREPA